MNMDNENKLRKELKYLLDNEIEIEINNYRDKLNDNNIKEIAKEIYLRRGLDVSKFEKTNIVEVISSLKYLDKDKKINILKSMLITILILLLMKLPFNLVRDIGYDYISILNENPLYEKLWSLLFLLLYTVTFVSTLIISLRTFYQKYKKLG